MTSTSLQKPFDVKFEKKLKTVLSLFCTAKVDVREAQENRNDVGKLIR